MTLLPGWGMALILTRRVLGRNVRAPTTQPNPCIKNLTWTGRAEGAGQPAQGVKNETGLGLARAGASFSIAAPHPIDTRPTLGLA